MWRTPKAKDYGLSLSYEFCLESPAFLSPEVPHDSIELRKLSSKHATATAFLAELAEKGIKIRERVERYLT